MQEQKIYLEWKCAVCNEEIYWHSEWIRLEQKGNTVKPLCVECNKKREADNQQKGWVERDCERRS